MIAALLLVHDAYLEGLLRKAEAERDATTGETRDYWQVHVDADGAALGAWRALWSVLV